MDDHKPGSMDITAQERTFESFMRFVSYAAALIVAVLVFMALVNA